MQLIIRQHRAIMTLGTARFQERLHPVAFVDRKCGIVATHILVKARITPNERSFVSRNRLPEGTNRNRILGAKRILEQQTVFGIGEKAFNYTIQRCFLGITMPPHFFQRFDRFERLGFQTFCPHVPKHGCDTRLHTTIFANTVKSSVKNRL